MSLVDEHSAAHAQEGQAVSSRSEFSLEGLPVGNAGDLMGVAKHVGVIYNADGSKASI